MRSGDLRRVLKGLEPAEIARICHDWLIWARADQLPPLEGEAHLHWRTWLLLGGRGAGKTRAGAEWVRAQALGLKPLATRPTERIALVGETLADARAVMVEGVSGLLSVHADHERPNLEASKRQVVWPNGAVAQIFSAEDPESLRGPQFGAAWCDELCKWRHAQASWDMLQFGLRLGGHPRQVVTTTPRAVPLLKALLADEAVVVSRAKTRDNAANLSAAFLAAVEARYGGTALGRQELDGEIIEDRDDALWRREWFEAGRISQAPDLARIVVAIDPPATGGAKSDACGLVVAGCTQEGCGIVLADKSLRRARPLNWAEAAVRAYHVFEADKIVAEVNQGGDMVEAIIRQVDARVPVMQVRASRGKWVRAEPVAALYARGLVRHVGVLLELEDELCDFGPDGLSGGRSPDRLDALVWALTELMLGHGGSPRIRPI